MNSPKKSTKYVHFLKQMKKTCFRIRSQSGEMMIGLGNNTAVSYTKNAGSGNDMWIVYPIDSGKYIIVNVLYGGVLDIQYRNEELVICINEYMSFPQQHWSLETVDTHLAYYKIRNLDIGMTIEKHRQDPYMYLNDLDTNNENTYWTFEEFGNMYVPIPSQCEQIDRFPQYKKQNDDLPMKTRPRLVGWTLFPSILVQGNRSFTQQLQECPYYILEKYQYWMKLHDIALLPKEKKIMTYTCGITEAVQTSLGEQIGIAIHLDSGIRFVLDGPERTYPIKKQMIQDLKISESQTEKKMIAKTEKVTYQNPFHFDFLYYAKYILTTEFILKYKVPNNKESYVEINQWMYTDPQTIQTTVYTKNEKITE